MTAASTITLTGWTEVQTWHEGHGEFVQVTYQKEVDPKTWSRRVECLVVSHYRNGKPPSFQIQNNRDYLMARDIRANPTRYVAGKHTTEPCCTAGSDDFEDSETGQRWRVCSVAGHGEWALKITDED